MPIESMAKRGDMVIAFGPCKPVGLKDPRTDKEPFAVVQLRQDNENATLYNIVGFQTRLRFPEQRRVFGMIPGLENAEFARYGVMHRNTFLNSPGFLDDTFRVIAEPRLSFAGQITGVEGYVESAASGFLVGVETAAELKGLPPVDFPQETAVGALALYVANGPLSGNFQPMNVNFGIIEGLGERIRNKREKNLAIARRSLEFIDSVTERSDCL